MISVSGSFAAAHNIPNHKVKQKEVIEHFIAKRNLMQSVEHEGGKWVKELPGYHKISTTALNRIFYRKQPNKGNKLVNNTRSIYHDRKTKKVLIRYSKKVASTTVSCKSLL